MEKVRKENYLAFVSATIPGCDELDHQSPILSAHVFLAKIVGLAQWGIGYQLEPIVLGEHAGTMAEYMPVAASHP